MIYNKQLYYSRFLIDTNQEFNEKEIYLSDRKITESWNAFTREERKSHKHVYRRVAIQLIRLIIIFLPPKRSVRAGFVRIRSGGVRS